MPRGTLSVELDARDLSGLSGSVGAIWLPNDDWSLGLSLARSGYDGSFYRFTFGPKYFFTPNVYGRAAFLADWYVGKNNNAGNLSPFDDGLRDHQQLVVFDVVATF